MLILTTLGVANHLDAAAVTGLQGRLVARQCGVVEGVLAPRVRPTVALVAVYRPRCGQTHIFILYSAHIFHWSVLFLHNKIL